jgi:DNA-binding MarR family transcriptional regulator
MNVLGDNDGICISDIKKSVHLSQATVTGIIDRLEKKGFVKREKCTSDKRRIEVWLTDQGREILQNAPPLLQEQFTEQFNKLEDWERTQILSSLERIVAMMEAKHIDATPILATGPIAATTEETKGFLKKTVKNGSNKTEERIL